MKYGDLSLGQVEAIINKLGGMDGAMRLLRDELTVNPRLISSKSVTFAVDTTQVQMPKDGLKGGWKVEEHRSLGMVAVSFCNGEMYINGHVVGEYLSDRQKNGNFISGDKLHAELANKFVLPNAILDLLLEEQYNPEVNAFLTKYQNRSPHFLGTIYRNPDGGGLFCCSITNYSHQRWSRNCHWIGCSFHEDSPVLVLAY